MTNKLTGAEQRFNVSGQKNRRQQEEPNSSGSRSAMWATLDAEDKEHTTTCAARGYRWRISARSHQHRRACGCPHTGTVPMADRYSASGCRAGCRE
jgi:hypothetical protein